METTAPVLIVQACPTVNLLSMYAASAEAPGFLSAIATAMGMSTIPAVYAGAILLLVKRQRRRLPPNRRPQARLHTRHLGLP